MSGITQATNLEKNYQLFEILVKMSPLTIPYHALSEEFPHVEKKQSNVNYLNGLV